MCISLSVFGGSRVEYREIERAILAPGLTFILSTRYRKRFSKTPKEAEGHPFVKGRLTLYKQVSERRKKG